MTNKISNSQVKHIAELSNLEISDEQVGDLSRAFDETLAVIDNLKSVDTSSIEPTAQVTGMENVWRDDEIDETQTFSQDDALSNAKKTYQGFFVVPRLIDNDE